jgi:hypothetical protein
MNRTHGPAPAFDPDRGDYPLGGDKTGPIWTTLWSLLSDGNLWSSVDLLRETCKALPDANRETVRNIAYGAVRAGILELVKRPRGRYAAMAHFRIKP